MDLYSILQYVTNPDEGIVEFSETDEEDHFGFLVDRNFETIDFLVTEERNFINGKDDVSENIKQTMRDDLKNDSKKIKNDFIRNVSGAIYDLGMISFQVMRPGLAEKLRKEEEKTVECCYRLETREAMLQVARETFETMESYADTLFTHDIDLTTLIDFTSNKVLTLLELLKKVKDKDEESRTIVFVEKRFTAEALTHLIMSG
jgi:ERCC4-related helicase